MNSDLQSVLNELIETSRDGEQGFLKASQDAEDAELKTLFAECSQRCAQGASELQSLVSSTGGSPETGGSLSGALHRGWISVREALTNRDDKAIVEECERGEDYAKAQYRKALEQDLPADTRVVLERQYQGVMANHDRVKALRDRFRST
jgi:uncharacterized protein (TIGR02284 family)